MFITTLLTISLPTKNKHVRVDTTLADDCFKVDLAPLVWWHGTKKKNRKNSLQKSRKSWILVQRTLKPVSCVTFTVSWISPDDASLPSHLQSMGYLCYVDTFGKRTSSILLDKVGKAIKITMLWNTSKHSPQSLQHTNFLSSIPKSQRLLDSTHWGFLNCLGWQRSFSKDNGWTYF